MSLKFNENNLLGEDMPKLTSKNLSYCHLKPIKEWHTNNVLGGYDNIPDLPITRFPDQILSVWKVESFWRRVKFLFSGKVYFFCQGSTHPPICIAVGHPVERTTTEY